MAKIERVDFDQNDLIYYKKQKCPIDNKNCDYDDAQENQEEGNPMRSCRHRMHFNSNISSPPCGKDLFRKKKSSKSKSKRKMCKCKK